MSRDSSEKKKLREAPVSFRFRIEDAESGYRMESGVLREDIVDVAVDEAACRRIEIIRIRADRKESRHSGGEVKISREKRESRIVAGNFFSQFGDRTGNIPVVRNIRVGDDVDCR